MLQRRGKSGRIEKKKKGDKKRGENHRKKKKTISIDEIIPQEHILRDIDKTIDFSFIYEEVKGLYSEDNGRPPVDPIVLFKIVMIQYIFGIRSMRQTIKEIEVNMAYRWFLGYDMIEAIPHFTTFGKNYTRRYAGSGIFEKIFERISNAAVSCGFVDASLAFGNATHIKASANAKKAVNEVVQIEAKHYQAELIAEIQADHAHFCLHKPQKTRQMETSCLHFFFPSACFLRKIVLFLFFPMQNPRLIFYKQGFVFKLSRCYNGS